MYFGNFVLICQKELNKDIICLKDVLELTFLCKFLFSLFYFTYPNPRQSFASRSLPQELFCGGGNPR